MTPLASKGIKIKKQSLIDWSIEFKGKHIGWIKKEYVKGNSGPYFYRLQELAFFPNGERFESFDFAWDVGIYSFEDAKKIIAENFTNYKDLK